MKPKIIVSDESIQNQSFLNQWTFFICGLFLSVLFTLCDNLTQNIILLPLISLISYLLIGKILITPCIITFLLTASVIFKDAASAAFDDTFGYLFYIIIFFFLSLLGSLCGCFIKWIILDFKQSSLIRKILVIIIWLLVLALSISALYLTDNLNGNPFTSCYAQIKMKDYLKKHYSDNTSNLSTNRYKSKGSYYTSTVRLYSEDTTQTFSIYYKKGKVWDDYFASYKEDLPSEYRLAEEASDQIKTLLASANIPFLSVDCSLKVAKGKYVNQPYNKLIPGYPLSINVYKLTKTKESYTDFGNWCEAVRFLLTNNGYAVSELTLESDPHFMANRLSLTLEDEQVSVTISDVSVLEHFIDYGILNHFDESLTGEQIGYNKVDFYYSERLSNEIKLLIHSAGFSNAHVKALVNADSEVELNIFWSGSRISIDHFAENIIQISDLLKQSPLYHTYTFLPLTCQYSWGTSQESYSFTADHKQLNEISSEVIVQTLLNENAFR